MPNVKECPHCEEEITQADVEEFAKSQREEELEDLFYSQPDVKRLNRKQKISMFLMPVGAFSGAILAACNTYSSIQFLAVACLGLVLGMIPGLLSAGKLEKMQKQFNLEHQ